MTGWRLPLRFRSVRSGEIPHICEGGAALAGVNEPAGQTGRRTGAAEWNRLERVSATDKWQEEKGGGGGEAGELGVTLFWEAEA